MELIMKKILLFLLLINIFYVLNAQNITKTSEYSHNWINRINRKTIDMHGALYEAIPGGNLVLISGRSPFLLIKEYKFLGARSESQAYYSHQRPISLLFDNAPSLGINMIEGYSIQGSRITRYSKYTPSYEDKLDTWRKDNAVFTNDRWIANTNANWRKYPVPQPEDVNWASGDYAGELY